MIIHNYIFAHMSNQHLTLNLFKPEVLIFHLKPALPIVSPPQNGDISQAEECLESSLSFSFSHIPYVMQISVGSTSKRYPESDGFHHFQCYISSNSGFLSDDYNSLGIGFLTSTCNPPV